MSWSSCRVPRWYRPSRSGISRTGLHEPKYDPSMRRSVPARTVPGSWTLRSSGSWDMPTITRAPPRPVASNADADGFGGQVAGADEGHVGTAGEDDACRDITGLRCRSGGVRRSERQCDLLLDGYRVRHDDHVRARVPRALNGVEAHAAGADHDHDVADLHVRSPDGCAQPVRTPQLTRAAGASGTAGLIFTQEF